MTEPGHQGPGIESDSAYEWLLSDHPEARAERDRRREATYQDEMGRANKVLAWVVKINATPDAPPTLRDLADTMGPLAEKSLAQAEADYAEPDAVKVARARADWETHMQVSAPNGSWDYRYPDRYVGETAAGQPRPGTEPEPEAEP
jgi:hypothetical protein